MKKGDHVQPGDFPFSADFYAVDESAQDSAGGSTRGRTKIWSAWVSVEPYLGLEAETAMREAGQTWLTIGSRFLSFSRIAKIGQYITVKYSASVSSTYEIRGVLPALDRRRVTRYTCRLLE